MGLFSFIDDFILDCKTAYNIDKIRKNFDSMKSEFSEPALPTISDDITESAVEVEELPPNINTVFDFSGITVEDAIVKEQDNHEEDVSVEIEKETSSEEIIVIDEKEFNEESKAEVQKSATKKPNKRVAKQKTQHSESMSLQMEDIDKILNNKRESIKVTPPGGGVGSAV